MSEVRDLFIKSQDSSSTGVYGLLARFGDILGRREPLVAAHHASLKIEPTYYAFRWVTTMLSREFELPDVLMIWDCLFADKHRFLLLLHICVAMLRCQRPKLLAADFGRTLKLLQNYPPVDTRVIVDAAFDVREEEVRDGIDLRSTSESPAPKSRPAASTRDGSAHLASGVGAVGVSRSLPLGDDASGNRLPSASSGAVSSAMSSAAAVAGSVTSAAWGFLSSLRSGGSMYGDDASVPYPLAGSAGATGAGRKPQAADDGQVLATLSRPQPVEPSAVGGVRAPAFPSDVASGDFGELGPGT